MKLLNIQQDDFVNYKHPSLFIGFPTCSGKCWKELGLKYPTCHNWSVLNQEENLEMSYDEIVELFRKNDLPNYSIVMGGGEPIDSWTDLFNLINTFRQITEADIVIYTGYREDEIEFYVDKLKLFSNIIVKFGRYIPKQFSHVDGMLGVELPSDNQYAVKIS